MGKVSLADKMRMQTLREQSYGAKAIVAAYLLKNWKLSTVKKICQRVHATGSATERKAGSGRPKCARSVTNIECVEDQDQWPPNLPDLNPLDYHVWGQCWRPITSAIRNRKRSPN